MFDLSKGDLIYLMSDGYQDQFGGPLSNSGGKKFLWKNLRQLLLENCQKPMAEQRMELRENIEKWRSGHERIHDQTDDITIIGIKY
jgi:serine phosphatase RsbU (regulator of sigma subunit)